MVITNQSISIMTPTTSSEPPTRYPFLTASAAIMTSLENRLTASHCPKPWTTPLRRFSIPSLARKKMYVKSNQNMVRPSRNRSRDSVGAWTARFLRWIYPIPHTSTPSEALYLMTTSTTTTHANPSIPIWALMTTLRSCLPHSVCPRWIGRHLISEHRHRTAKLHRTPASSAISARQP